MYYVHPGGIDICAINTSWISSFLNVMSKIIPNQIITNPFTIKMFAPPPLMPGLTINMLEILLLVL